AGMVSDVYLVPVRGGEPKRLTFDDRGVASQLTWTADGKEILFCSDRGGAATLWRIAVSGGNPRPVAGAGAGDCSPAVSPKGNQLAYQHSLQKSGVWRLALSDLKRAPAL